MMIGADQLVAGIGLVITTMISQYFITRRHTQKLEDSIQRRHEENQAAQTRWQADQVKLERSWRLEAENERMKEQRECDRRIDSLREKYDNLYENYVKVLQEKGQLRVEVHDLRNELASFKMSLMPGGRRMFDPPSDSTVVVIPPKPEPTPR